VARPALQSKLHFALSSQLSAHVTPGAQMKLHVAFSEQLRLHVPVVQVNVHVSRFLHSQLMPHSFEPGGLVVPPSFVGLMTPPSPPLDDVAPDDVDPDDDDVPPVPSTGPLPIVQSNEHAATNAAPVSETTLAIVVCFLVAGTPQS
jgi:hypothetical protein